MLNAHSVGVIEQFAGCEFKPWWLWWWWLGSNSSKMYNGNTDIFLCFLLFKNSLDKINLILNLIWFGLYSVLWRDRLASSFRFKRCNALKVTDALNDAAAYLYCFARLLTHSYDEENMLEYSGRSMRCVKYLLCCGSMEHSTLAVFHDVS